MLLTALGKYAATNEFIRIKIRSAAGETIDLYTQKTISHSFFGRHSGLFVSKIDPKPLKKRFKFYPDKTGLKSKYPDFFKTPPPTPRGGCRKWGSSFIRIISGFNAL